MKNADVTDDDLIIRKILDSNSVVECVWWM